MDPVESTPSSTPAAAEAAPSAEASAAASAALSTPVPATPGANSVTDDIDGEWDDFTKQQGDGGDAANLQAQDTDDTLAGDNAATKPTADAGAALSDEDKQAIKRHGLDPDDIAAMRNLTPESRKRWVANLDKRAKYVDELQQQLKANKPADDEKPAEQQQQAAPPALDEAWKAVDDTFSPYGLTDVAPTMKKAFDAHAAHVHQTVVAPLQKLLGTLLDRMTEDDQAAAFDQLELPEGVDKNDPKVREQLIAEAEILLNGSFDFKKFNYRHAIPRAATTLFHQKITAAQQAQQKKTRTQSLRGTAEPANRPPSVQPTGSDDEFEDAALSAILKGDDKKLAQLTAG